MSRPKNPARRRRIEPRGSSAALPAAAAAMFCAVLLLGAGCEVGPNYRRPGVVQPAAFKSVPASQPAHPVATVPAEWWRLFNDPELDRLIAEANANNQNLREAAARVEQARAQARIAVSYLLPSAELNPQFTRSRTSGTRVSSITGLPTRAFTFNDYLVPFDLRYEIDAFGRLRRGYETAEAQARAAAYDQGFVRLTVDTDVAVYYFALRSFDAQEQILSRSVEAFTEQVRIVGVQLKNGLVTPVDLYQAQAQLSATLAQETDVRRARADEEHALATLCGRAPPLFSVAANPLINPTAPVVPAGLPAELLTRRPDVAEAEQTLVAANAQVGVAVADFYPTFTITGTAGFESASASNLFDWRSKVASIGPGISVPLFEGGRLTNNLRYARARYDEAKAGYVNTILTAYRDVEDALTDLHALTDEVQNLKEAVGSSQAYLRVSGVQYRRGLTTYLIVIDAERTLLNNQLTLAQTTNQQVAASIHLIQALGGGWKPDAKP